MTRQQRPQQYKFKAIGQILIAFIILTALLLADLQFHGLAWGYFYKQTGEESIAGQIQGMVELSGNLIRLPAQTAPLEPIEHTEIFPYGINTFFEQETEIEKMQVQFQMIADAGFGWIRQEFPWEDIEVDGRGEFTDGRVDYDGDGIPDTIDAWEKYDTIVELAGEYNLDMIVRLSNPPAWSRAENPETEGGAKAPPDDYQDFVNYAIAVAERYQGQISTYQVWNEPNIYPEWGEQFASPENYMQLLCMTYDALKEVDPDIIVISGTIAPTASLDGYYGYHDLVYLQNMYQYMEENDREDCFDVLSAQGYGLNSGPTDRRQRATHLSFARHIQYRDIMVTNGDADKPIWLSEVAWSPMLEPCLETGECLSREAISGAGNFGEVTNEQAARYLRGAYERANEEWSWIGHISYWHFTRPTIHESDQVAYWFRMVEADYSPENPTFSPLPVYYSAQNYLTEIRENPVLYRGTHQAESWEITVGDESELLSVDNAEFEQAIRTRRLEFTANATSVNLRLQVDSPIIVSRDGEVIATIVADPTVIDWQNTIIASDKKVPYQAQYILISDSEFIVDSLTVKSQFWFNMMPLMACFGSIFGLMLLLGFPMWRHYREERRIEQMRQQTRGRYYRG